MLGDLARSFSMAMLVVFVLIGGGMWLLHRAGRRSRAAVARVGAEVVIPPPAAAVGD